jgi:hypothetical protein
MSNDIPQPPEFYKIALNCVKPFNARVEAEGHSDDSYLFACRFCGGIGKAKWGESASAGVCGHSHEHMIGPPSCDMQQRLWEMAKYWSAVAETKSHIPPPPLSLVGRGRWRLTKLMKKPRKEFE